MRFNQLIEYIKKGESGLIDFNLGSNPEIIQAESLEAAELIKLANNTFRDVSFNFANELYVKLSFIN